MTDTRKPKFDFMPKPRAYGKLDISAELVICEVHEGRLRAIQYPESWEQAVTAVQTVEGRANYARRKQEWDDTLPQRQEAENARAAAWNAANPTKRPRKPEKLFVSPVPSAPTLVLGLNEHRDGYEVVFDPHDLAGSIDPMMLLNFRRKV